MLLILLQFLPLLVIAGDDEWFVMGRHGGCFPIELLAERQPILENVRQPVELVENLRKDGGNPTIDNVNNLNIVITVKDEEKNINLAFVKRHVCREFPNEARKKAKEDRKKAEEERKPKILSIDDTFVFSKKGNPIGLQIKMEIQIPKSSYRQEVSVPNMMKHNPPAGYVFTSGLVPMYRLSFQFPKDIVEFEHQYETQNFSDYKIISFKEMYLPNYIIQEKEILCYKEDLSFYGFEHGPSTVLLNDPKHPEKNFQVTFGFSIVGNEIKTKNLYDLRDFYQGYLKEGVKECHPVN